MEIEFDGQQTNERILARIIPHPIKKIIGIISLLALAFALVLVCVGISVIIPSAAGYVFPISVIIGLLIIVIGFWWNDYSVGHTITYITDRRIIRFEAITPFTKTKRALFWNEAMKVKAFSANLFKRLLRMGNVVVEPQISGSENVIISDIGMYEDVANFIDKILFTFKNQPQEMNLIHQFVPKPKGQRGNQDNI
jgi:hypothetical protein